MFRDVNLLLSNLNNILNGYKIYGSYFPPSESYKSVCLTFSFPPLAFNVVREKSELIDNFFFQILMSEKIFLYQRRSIRIGGHYLRANVRHGQRFPC